MTEHNKVIAYYRVSTTMQGESGLGLEAQQSAVHKYCEDNDYEIVKEYTEVESGGKEDRKILAEALEEVDRIKCSFMVAKLDRFSRVMLQSVKIRKKLGDRFIALDQVNSNDFMYNIYAAVAEQERQLISDRVKAAIQAKKDRNQLVGRKPGQPRDCDKRVIENLTKYNAEFHKELLEKARPILEKYKYKSIKKQVEKIGEAGIRTKMGTVPKDTTVKKWRRELGISCVSKYNLESKIEETKTEEVMEDNKKKDDLVDMLKDYSPEQLVELMSLLGNKKDSNNVKK